MSYSKDHSRKNPLAPSRMYGLSSSANTNTTPVDSKPSYSTYNEGKEGENVHKKVDFSAHGFSSFSDAVKHRDAMKKQHGRNWRSQPGMGELQADINKRLTKPKVEVKEKQELLPTDKTDAKLIDTSSTMPSLRTIQTGVPEVGTKSREKRDFNFTLPDINLPKINFPSFQKKSGVGKSRYRISSRFGGGKGMQKKFK